MDLSFFLTTQTPQSGKDTELFPGLGKGASSENDLDLFFKTLLEGGFPEQKEMILSDTTINNSTDFQTLNAQLTNSIASLEALFSSEPDSADIVEIQEFLESLDGQIVISKTSTNEYISLSDQAKFALLGKLIGTPLNSLHKNVGNSSDASPFANTEAALNGRDLFEKILQNLNQNEGIQLSAESLIAAGVSPQDLELMAQQEGSVTLHEPVNNEPGVISDDLIALLGLIPHTSTQSNLAQQKGADPINKIELWFQGEEDGAAVFKEIKTMADLKAAMQQTAQAGENSKAAQMMAGTANQNQTEIPSFFIQTTSADGVTEWFDLETNQWTSVPSLPSALNGMNITSTLVQAPNAQSAHPATQMIAASIQKNAGSSESRNWTLRLDPPDLGKVEVRLTFSDDKSVKAHMIIEKPETWMMLQRDAQILERALQNAGLDVDGGSIGFELAENGDEFSQNGSHDGRGSGGHGAGSMEDDIEIIETTMTWFVDPESGVQRYNLVV